MRPQFLYGVSEAARTASRLGIPAISVIEFGVAAGAGLLSLEEVADKIEAEHNVKIQIYGFDLGSGLPPPTDYRDLPYTWMEGFFKMDEAALQSRLRRAKLLIGNVAETAKDFFQKHQPAPIGFISFDLDFYSSTKDAFAILRSENFDNYLPRVYCYFDDTIGTPDEIHCEYVGEMLAIKEFNDWNEHRKIAKINGLRYKLANSPAAWIEQIYVFHLFTHPNYNKFIRKSSEWQLPLPRAPSPVGKLVHPREIDFNRTIWKFWRSNGSMIAPALKLVPGGRIDGYSHQNEAKWAIIGDSIVFLRADGTPTSRYESIYIDASSGKLNAVGRYLPAPVDFQLILTAQ